MPWIPEEHMADIHLIRQDYARAKRAKEENYNPETAAAYDEVYARRARAIRMIHHEDNASVRHLSAMFRISKGDIRTALADDN